MAESAIIEPAPVPAPVPSIVAIDGIDGSGKSTFADQLTAGLHREGWQTVLFHVDDFRRPVDWARAQNGDVSESELYYRDYYDLDRLEGCLRAFLARAGRVTIPVFDARTEGLDGVREVVIDWSLGATVAIVEGVFPLRVPSAARGLVIYLDVPEGEAQSRLTARDLGRGRSRETIEHRLAARYRPAQERYHQCFDPARRADVVIDNRRVQGAGSLRRQLGRMPAALAAALDRLLPPLVVPPAPPVPPPLVSPGGAF
jgi:uridine kinase